MKHLGEIIEEIKDGNIPTHDECYWALLALHYLHNHQISDIKKIVYRKILHSSKEILEDCIRRDSNAKKQDPKEWIGEEYDPHNPKYQELRKTLKELIKD